MNRIITINLGGFALSIEEDAYELLRDYLNKLRKHFGESTQGKEIQADIESRMAELFHAKILSGALFITLQEVKEACALMGEPYEMEQGNDGTEDTYQRSEIPRRLFRDTELGIFGGVCAGLATYFNVDVVMIRVISLVLFFAGGIGFIPYLLMWIIVPKAQTKADRLAMQGKSPNLRNFQDAFMEEANRVGDNILRESKQGRWAQKAQSLSRTLGMVLLGFIKFFAGIIGVVLVVAAIALLFGLSFGKIYTDVHLLPLSQLPTLLGLGNWTLLLQVALLLVILIPAIRAIVFIAHYVMNTRPLPGTLRKTLSIIWTLSFLSVIGLIIYAAMLFSEQNEVLTKHTIQSNVTLLVEADLFEASPERLSLHRQEIHFSIMNSSASEPELWVRKSARGITGTRALNSAEMINDEHNITGSRIMLPGNLRLKASEPYRAQKIEYTLRVPVGTHIRLNRNTTALIDHIDNLNNVWGKELSGHLLYMSESGLSCLDCEQEPQVSGAKKFEHIEADGAFNIFIRQGAGADYEFRGDQTYRNDILVTEEGSTLKLSMREGVNWKKLPFSGARLPEIWIKTPVLKSIQLRGAHKTDLLDFNTEVLHITLEGASKLKASGISAEILDLEMEGAGWMELSGNAQKLLLKQEGATRFSGFGFQTQEAAVHLSGATLCELNASERISGKADGASKLNYRGSPEINIQTSGAVRIKPENL